MFERNFIGKNGFIWWIGVVENRLDPAGLGRCQVRIFGWHGDGTDADKALIQTSDLPWAHPIFPLNASKKFSTPSLGEWVVGFFLDGESGQAPVMMGVLPGFSQTTTGVDGNTSTAPQGL